MNRLRGANGNKSSAAETFAPVEIKYPGISIASGQYRAYCRDARVYRDGGFKRWTCLLDFDILSEGLETLAKLPLWLNLGAGQKPQVTRRSNYLAAWIKANGAPPSRMDRLSPRVFLRRMCRVAVALTSGPLPRSVVKEILEWETGQSQFRSSALASVEGCSTQQTTQPAGAVLKKTAPAKAIQEVTR